MSNPAFNVNCKNCGSTDVHIQGGVCGDCDSAYYFMECIKCGASYDSHTGDIEQGEKQ